MTLAFGLLLWVAAFLAHGFLQPKMCRILMLPHIPGYVLHPCRTFLPLAALYLCCRQGTLPGVLAWFGTASVAGICACLILTIISLRQIHIKELANETGAAF